ncbi:type II toxin-antitoxin system Phd/YefM family antitoxin [Ketogulonicigenium vulgare]|uniref:type II toxin-antitoxin system Phd/YefM family antitoxin n=1 Tax=Ketogulonicigenium vulgare TaxID=92945 RepID=UPI002358BE3E|nr:type II toxin-antitoxin system Phd/YefM family antitoxin [Ketogulonicigenium vulgare]
MQRVSAGLAMSISDLKKNPSAAFDVSGGQPVAILNHNKVVGYMVTPDRYEALLEALDDARLAETIRERSGEVPVALDWNEL